MRTPAATLATVIVSAFTVGLLAGCGGVDPDAVEPDDTTTNSPDSQQTPIDVAVNPDLVAYVSPDNWGIAQAECVGEAGFPGVMATPDGGASFPEVPPAQTSEYLAAQDLCSRQYPVEPRFRSPLTETQRATLHEYYEQDLIPCIENEGFDVDELPSQQRFIETYFTEGWSPFAEITFPDEVSWLALRATCPEWPDNFFD